MDTEAGGFDSCLVTKLYTPTERVVHYQDHMPVSCIDKTAKFFIQKKGSIRSPKAHVGNRRDHHKCWIFSVVIITAF